MFIIKTDSVLSHLCLSSRLILYSYLERELALASITFLADYNSNQAARANFFEGKVLKRTWIWKVLTDGLILQNKVLCPTSISWQHFQEGTTQWTGSRSQKHQTQFLSDFMENNTTSGNIIL
jgi:hypothetical protein